jgi:hypothetical protein
MRINFKYVKIFAIVGKRLLYLSDKLIRVLKSFNTKFVVASGDKNVTMNMLFIKEST